MKYTNTKIKLTALSNHTDQNNTINN